MEVKIGIVGLGTVGFGLIELINKQANIIRERLGLSLIIAAVAEPNLGEEKRQALRGVRIYADGMDLVRAGEIDILVELVGGVTFPKELIQAAFKKGMHVVSANKALLATEGQALYALAAEQGCALGIEASVAGGVPIIKTIRESLVGNKIEEIRGIINGTCNYILTRMSSSDTLGFADALAEAQERGFAEADPTLDISGGDAAHKIAILAALAFNTPVEMEDVYIEGIDGVEGIDVRYARVLGYAIKLLGIAKDNGNAGVETRVHPTLIPLEDQLAAIRNEFNAVFLRCDFLGAALLSGRGAGAYPTASAVIGDVTDIALMMRDHKSIPPFFNAVRKREWLPFGKTRNRYYMRFTTLDRPGIVSKITGILCDNNISIAKMVQMEEFPDNLVPVVMLSHTAFEEDAVRAITAIDRLPGIQKPTKLIRAL
jgi:homoserine dehydrogenase